MKRISVFTVFILCVSLSHVLACELTVRVPTSSYPPGFIQDKKDKWFGLSVELAEILLSEAGCTPVYKQIPFKRALYYIEFGKIDMMMNLTRTQEREQFIYFIGPQFIEKIILVVLKDSDWAITSLDDLKKLPKNIGVDRGFIYGPAFEKKRKTDSKFKAKLEVITDIEQNAQKLRTNRISAFISYEPTMAYAIKTDPLYQNFKIHTFVIHEAPVHFGFSKKAVSKELFYRLQAAYDRTKEKGLFQGVYDKYGIR